LLARHTPDRALFAALAKPVLSGGAKWGGIGEVALPPVAPAVGRAATAGEMAIFIVLGVVAVKRFHA
jgi:hypothetical protein